MKLVYVLLLWSFVAVAPAAQAAEADDDWKMFGGILSLVQSFVHIAATTDDPQVMQKNFDGLLAGRSPEANRIAGEMMGEMMEDMPQQYRGTIHALARDVLTIARRENARAAAQGPAPAGLQESREAMIQARKDLTAMGLRYYDAEQYHEALRRGDTLAVELFIAARGVSTAN